MLIQGVQKRQEFGLSAFNLGFGLGGAERLRTKRKGRSDRSW